MNTETRQTIEDNTILILMIASALLGIAGPAIGLIIEATVGWDIGVYNYCIACFPAGLLALMLSAWLMSMVDGRRMVEREDRMNAIRKSRAK